MNQHVTEWLGAYHDGELGGLRLGQVEAHLDRCAACRAELEGLQALGALLQESPAAEGLTSPDRFVAQVGLRLPRRQVQPTWQRALETGWRLVPVGLTGAWVFIQTVFVVSMAVLIALQAGVGGEILPQVEPSLLARLSSLSGANLSDAGWALLQLLSGGGPLGWGVTLYLASMFVIGLLYWSWLASLWARRRHRQLQLV